MDNQVAPTTDADASKRPSIFDLADWPTRSTTKFSTFVQGKCYTDNMPTWLLDTRESGYNLTQPALLALDKGCWWCTAPGGAVGVMVAPFRKSAWYDKHKATLELPEHSTFNRGVWFARMSDVGVPEIQPFFGIVAATWSSRTPITMTELTPGESRAMARQHQYWGTIAMSLWTATALNLTKKCDEV